jgi:hypothetical protein
MAMRTAPTTENDLRIAGDPGRIFISNSLAAVMRGEELSASRAVDDAMEERDALLRDVTG